MDIQTIILITAAFVAFVAALVVLSAAWTLGRRKLNKEIGLLKRHLRYHPKPASREYKLE
jgi:hypothetical protein